MTKRLKPGDKFGRWTIIEPHRIDGKVKGHKCQCSCNARTIKIIQAGSLTNGTSTSCGCLRKELLKANNPMFNPKIAQKVSDTRKERGIAPTKECRDAAQSTDARKKRKATNNKKYGADSPFASKEIQTKVRKTNNEKYGGNAPACSPAVRDKMKTTNQDRYGVDNIMELPEQKQAASNRMKETRKAEAVVLPNGQPRTEYAKEHDVLRTTFNNWQAQGGTEFAMKKATCEEKRSSLEALMEVIIPELKFYNRKILEYRPDFKINDDIYMNIDGLYWHGELMQSNNRYHKQMSKIYEDNNMRIIQFRGDELVEKSDIVRSMVRNLQGKSIRVFARKTDIKVVSQTVASKFLISNHLMGNAFAKHIGLYLNNELVSLMSYKQVGGNIKIERFCNLLSHTVIGGFSKILSKIEKDNPTAKEIHNWVDLRYGNGIHLLNKGFSISHETLGWKWTDGRKTYNRMKCKAIPGAMTERQHANSKGWYKIYDAGQRLFIKPLR